MAGDGGGTVFSDVDASGMAPELIDYLERVQTRPSMRELDRISYALLGISAGQRLLEVGCGLGDDAREMAALAAPGGHVTAIDVSRAMVAEARRRAAAVGAAAVDYAVADVRRLPYGDATFDGARAERVFQHLADADAAVAEMARVVRSGGLVAVVDPDWQTLVVDLDDLEVARRMSAHVGRFGVRGHAGRQLRGLLLGAGLVDVEVRAAVVVETTLAGAATLLPMLDERIPAEVGMVPSDIRDDWFRLLRERDAAGRFFASLTAFVAAGRRP